MARIRTIKPDFFADEKLSKLKRDVRLLYVGMWVFSDDYGTVRSNPIWIKSNVYPYDEELRVNDVKLWLDALVKARMLEPFCYNGEGFYNIRTFDTHQKVEKKSKPVVPLEDKRRLIAEQSGNSRGVVGEYSVPEVGSSNSTEDLVSSNRANALVGSPPTEGPKKKTGLVRNEVSTGPPKADYLDLVISLSGKEKKEVVEALKTFIEKRPVFLEPYCEYWNIAITGTNIPSIDLERGLTEQRLKKLQTRLREPAFDFLELIRKIVKSPSLRKNESKEGNRWFSFDWMIESQAHCTKIIEGNYS